MLRQCKRYVRQHLYQILIVGMFVLCLCVIGVLASSGQISASTSSGPLRVKDFNLGWHAQLQNGDIVPLELFPEKLEIPRGQSYTLSNQLPLDVEDGMTLALHSSRQNIDVFLDGNPVLSSHSASPLFPFSPVSGYVFVPLKHSDAGRQVEVRLSSYYSGCTGRVDEIFYGYEGDCVITSVRLHGPMLFLYLVFFVTGAALIIAFVFIKERHHEYLEWFYLGILSVLLSAWMILEGNLIQVFWSNNTIAVPLSLLCQFALPFPFIAYIRIISKSKRTHTVLDFIAYCFVAGGILTLWLHLMRIVDFSISSTYYMLTLVVVFVGVIALMVAEICMQRNFELISIYLCSTVLITAIAMEAFSFFFYKGSYRSTGVFLGAGLLSYLCIMGIVSTNRIATRLKHFNTMREELTQNRVALMLSQIQPHFIYNTLNSIHALVDIDTQKASAMIVNFSKYLRGHIDALGQEDSILFAQEIDNIRAYLEIETVRFPKIRVLYDIQADDFFVPVLTIQPLVENAVRHGVSKLEGCGTIVIRSYAQGNGYTVQVIDDGVGFAVDEVACQARSMGIRNITYRLEHLAHATIEFNSEPQQGTVVRLWFPRNAQTQEEGKS